MTSADATRELTTLADARSEPLPLSRRELAFIAAFWALFAAVTVANRMLDPRRMSPLSATWDYDLAIALTQSGLWALFTIPLFLLSARVGVDRGVRRTRVVQLLLAGVVAALLVSSSIDAVRAAMYTPPPGRIPRIPRPTGWTLRFGGFQFLNDLVIAFGVMAAGFARAYSVRYRARLAQAVLLQAQLADARLDSLRRQLDPHFLFNTLNAVSSLVERDPRGVRRMISRLSEVLRYSMEGAHEPEIPLRRELDMLRRYIDIMQVRFQGRLEVEMRIDDAALDALVPNMILQPIVENAIQHGVERLNDTGRIVLSATVEDAQVVLRVQDNGPGVDAIDVSVGAIEAAVDIHGTTSEFAVREGGVGLRNTMARLQQLYGSEQRFTLRTAADGGAVAELCIPYHTVADMFVSEVAPGGTSARV